MTYILIPEVDRHFEWDQTKSDWNRVDRDLPFDLAVLLFNGPTLERRDTRQDYRELRVQAIGAVNGTILQCVFTDRGEVRRIISLGRANKRERDVYSKAFQN